MIIRRFFSVAIILLAVTACSSESYESVSEEIDALLAKPVPISADDKARMTSLREEAEKLHRDGKTADALNALTKARAIIHKARDAELLGKSDG